MEPYLYHGIRWNNFGRLKRILKSGYILSRAKQDNKPKDNRNIFNGEHYISLCQKSLVDDSLLDTCRVSFNDFVYRKPCIVLKNYNINLVYPILISESQIDSMSPDEWKRFVDRKDESRCSYYMDELQVKDQIELKGNIIAVGIPMEVISSKMTNKERDSFLEGIYTAVNEDYNGLPILDSSVYSFADNEEEIKKHTLVF